MQSIEEMEARVFSPKQLLHCRAAIVVYLLLGAAAMHLRWLVLPCECCALLCKLARLGASAHIRGRLEGDS